MSIKNYLTCILVCFTSTLISQNCNLKFQGTVKDFHDSTPIIGATIQIEGLKTYAVTDDEGNFILKNICAPQFTIKVAHVSCETKLIKVDLTKTPSLIIKLEHHIEELNEVTVTSDVDKKTKTAQETVLKGNILNKYSTLSLGDAIKEIPGISSINTGNSIVKPVINGLHSSRVLVMTNNVRLQD